MEGIEVIRRIRDEVGMLRGIELAAGKVAITFIKNQKGEVIEKRGVRRNLDGSIGVGIPELYYNNAFTTASAILTKEE